MFLCSLLALSLPCWSVSSTIHVPKSPHFDRSKSSDEDDIDGLWGEGEEQNEEGSDYHWQRPPVVGPTEGFNLPNESTVWEHGQTGVRVEWEGFEGRTVSIELLWHGEKIADLRPWHQSSGSFVRSAPVPDTWGSGPGFRVRIVDDSGDSMVSDQFQILAPFTVVQPDSSTSWAHNQEYAPVSWTSIDGDRVMIELRRSQDSTLVSRVSDWVPNQGSYRVPLVSPEWGTGDSYLLQVTDDLGNYTYSQPFSIHGIRVDCPEEGAVWSIGQRPPRIEWSCIGTLVRVELWREDGDEPVSVLADWIPNTGSLAMEGAEVDPLLRTDGRYYVKIINDLEQVGYSGMLDVAYSDNLVQGACRLTGTAEGEIDPPGDNDYWRLAVPGGRMIRVVVTSSLPLGITVFETDSLPSPVVSSTSDRVRWFAEEEGEYLVNVAAESSDATGGYSIEYSYSSPPDAFRSFRLSWSVGSTLGDFRDVAGGSSRFSFDWLPREWLEVGLDLLLTRLEPEAYSEEPCSLMVYVGPHAGFRTDLYWGFDAAIGAFISVSLDETERQLRSEYEDYSGAVEGGFKPYLGLEHPVMSFWGIKYILRMDYVFLENTGGMLEIGLYGAF
jgi:hypothetical protein